MIPKETDPFCIDGMEQLELFSRSATNGQWQPLHEI